MKEEMKIKKGDWFRCLRTLIMDSADEYAAYNKDEHYQSERDGFITNEKGNKSHAWPESESCLFKKLFIKLYTIQDLKDGKVAVVNDGTVEELNEVLNYAFPNTHDCLGTFSYYRLNIKRTRWKGVHAPGLPTQSVKDFLVQLPKEENNAEHKFPVFETIGTIKGTYMKTCTNDPINPNHYQFSINGTPCDLFDIINAMGLDIEQATALRYFRKKENQIEDTKKAIKCLERYLDKLENLNI